MHDENGADITKKVRGTSPLLARANGSEATCDLSSLVTMGMIGTKATVTR